MSIATAPAMAENGDNYCKNEPRVERVRIVEDGSSFRVEVEDRDPNKINEHLQVKSKVK